MVNSARSIGSTQEMNGTYCYSHSCSFFSQNTKSIKPGILWSGKQSKLSQPPTSGDTGATAQGLGASPVHFPGRVLFSAKRWRRTVALRRWAPARPPAPGAARFRAWKATPGGRQRPGPGQDDLGPVQTGAGNAPHRGKPAGGNPAPQRELLCIRGAPRRGYWVPRTQNTRSSASSRI